MLAPQKLQTSVVVAALFQGGKIKQYTCWQKGRLIFSHHCPLYLPVLNLNHLLYDTKSVGWVQQNIEQLHLTVSLQFCLKS
jgi:hypothetical protein